MNKLMVFMVDKSVNILYKNRIICEKLSSVNKGMVTNRLLFIEEFVRILKKEKIKTKMFGEDIVIVKNSFFEVSDMFFLENIFTELGFIKVLFKDIKDLMPKDEASYIEINESYMVINFDKGLFFDLDYFKDIPKVLEYFKNDFKNEIVLFGVNKFIPKIKVKGLDLYYFDDFREHIVNSLLKAKKS